MTLLVLTATVQAVYYVLTGIWPILSIDTFQRVTGPKTDLWLVKMIGALFAVIGLTIGVAVLYADIDRTVAVLAISCAVAVIIVDVWYVSRRVISRVYLLDALAEVFLLIGWSLGLFLAG
ncbi:hypothetical protein [Larkinella arboricola]|uniref:DoxX-like protein n=1 Tax=Larkinella arboricola TaxID=643671 RepID=A0A327WXJ4_LARAB|nr:hypothetical protein [Larkinella arboricola]RAJ94245.1 hypothetical protein LX87_04130 [Larkinella arboricola]